MRRAKARRASMFYSVFAGFALVCWVGVLVCSSVVYGLIGGDPWIELGSSVGALVLHCESVKGCW